MAMKECPCGFRPCTRCHSGKTNGHAPDYARYREFRPPRNKDERIKQRVHDASILLGGEYVETRGGVPRVVFDGVIDGGTSVVWFNRTERWRVFEPDWRGPNRQQRTDFKTIEEVVQYLRER